MSDSLLETANYYVAASGIVVLVVSAILVFDFKTSRSLAPLIKVYGLMAAFLISLFTTLLTFTYSEYFGFVPCGLCWLQRIFLFPQVVLLAGALFYKDKQFPRYGILLSIFGFIIAAYQHYLQMGGGEILPCPATGPGADCTRRLLFEFGFMTFPLLSAITFLFLIVLYVYILKTRTE